MRNRKPKRPVKSRRLAAKPAPICTGYWADQRGWSDYVKSCVEQYRWTRRLPLNHHDWDDIKQACLIRAWEKRDTFDENRGAFMPWLKTLVTNHTRNEIRNRLSFGRSACGQLRRNFVYPRAILTKTVTPVMGREEVVYIPDAPDPKTCFPLLPETKHLRFSLEKDEKKVYDRLLKRGLPSTEQQQKSGDYQRNLAIRKSIRAKWRRLIDQSI